MGTPRADVVPLTAGAVEIYLSLAAAMDVEAERLRLGRELDGVEAQIARLEDLLSGPFAARAPAEIVAAERRKLDQARDAAARLRSQLQGLIEG